ncbi:MAG: hypothetical protein A2406_02625 [Candidatus Komeilibacteria bacterium RIFOXYC1_FULL_37_11]|uniref:dolichyl-phosphate beta-glucosyltransferase n=1 Tax=Candidatus Komeilibacteria bacterium RIFOXYC1_FULL_37_11 TaxID=1798555 RepID=A0A1G2BZU2_9BACT|nr:MAG: hypothetical protein A2406_02625 [Candidatus Komeilibacteria bacterium RIFOXYC1_FULL_37_11]OGY95452.1 MAG: hypothetical protein A2611_02000 [Candidatus Komeilibacteria bacterium RIFOXYD1_FULL_37_29]OGY96740.1 MAG: hypothetical protein A2543_02525 [Candidatus Komeilibacteria bacterium RIFOXYD2_FULL_37_8]
MEISVVIPAFNEVKDIAKTIADVGSYLKNHFSSFEIIVVDDKSNDRTLQIIQSIDGIRVLKNLKNHGKGYAVAKGMKAATGDLLLFMDADNSTKISELDNFLSELKNYDVVIASRGLKDSKVTVSQNFLKTNLGRMGNFFSRILIDENIRDTQCGFKLFKKSAKHLFDKLTIEGFAFDFELIFLARKYKFKVKEMPVVWVNNFNSAVRWYDYPKTMLNLIGIRINNLLGKYN